MDIEYLGYEIAYRNPEFIRIIGFAKIADRKMMTSFDVSVELMEDTMRDVVIGQIVKQKALKLYESNVEAL